MTHQRRPPPRRRIEEEEIVEIVERRVSIMGFGKIIGVVTGLVGVLVSITLIFGTWYTVPEYQRVVVARLGTFQSVEGPGLHFRIPVVHVIEYFDTNVQELTPKG